MAVTYSEKLKDPRWQKKRLEVLQRDNFTCMWCGDTKTTLHVHHNDYKGEPWDVPDYFLSTLCADCHKVDSIKTLTSLEVFLIDAFRNRERNNTDTIKTFNRIVLREKNIK